jgi:serine/threonine protein kinase
MGTVYLAYDTQLDRQVALKIPQFSATDSPSVMERFFREARAAATLHHASICPVYDVGEINGTHYLTMAYIEGRPLSELIRTSAKGLTSRQAAALARRLALALEEAHSKKVIHRDLKPSNVMLTKRGEPVIMDFGLARRGGAKDAPLTQYGSVMGTPAYMAPEQAKGNPDEMGPACDIYSLGVILYELLAGRPPFEGDAIAVLSQVLMDTPKSPSKYRPDVDRELEAICLKAMAKRPESRYRSMGELAGALGDYLKGTSQPAQSVVAQTQPAPEQPLAELLRELEPPGAVRIAAADFHVSQSGGRPSPTQRPRELDMPGEAILSRTGRTARNRKLSPRFWIAGAAGAAGLILVGIVFWVPTDSGTSQLEQSNLNPKSEVKGPVPPPAKSTELRPPDRHVEIPTEVPGKPAGTVADPKIPVADSKVFKGGRTSEWVPLCNGRDLTGWKGNLANWRIQDGVIVGKLPNQPITSYTYLCSEKKYRDFELRLKARLLGGNSGVQVRSLISNAETFDVGGPQVEIAPGRGVIWGTVVTAPTHEPSLPASADDVLKILRPSDFNELSITCVGRHITVMLNGTTVNDADFPSMPNEGIIALQLHKGHPGMEVHFKDIEIRLLDGSSQSASTPKSEPPPPVAASRPKASDRQLALFDGEDLSAWIHADRQPARWKVGRGFFEIGGGGNLLTKQEFAGDHQIHIEFLIPRGRAGDAKTQKGGNSGNAKPERRGNSGVFVQGRYEIQILDSYGSNPPTKQDCGALYGQAAPLVNACKQPGAWQTMDISFRAPKLDARGKIIAKPRIHVVLNDQTVLNDVELETASQAALNSAMDKPGPLMLQDHGDPVRFRNVWVKYEGD